jgi:hypothetical protein
MVKKLSGGGITMNKNVRENVRAGPRSARAVDPAGLSQYGTAQGGKLKQAGSFTGQNSATPVFSGSKANPAPFGNAKALDVGAGGVGTGHTIYKSGYQSLHGAPAAGSSPTRKDILSEFGPDVPGRRR